MKKFTPEAFPENKIVFGNGGGFAGTVTEYTLLENGQLFKKFGLGDEYEELDKIKKKDARKYFEQADTVAIKDVDFNRPGNMYYFLEVVEDSLGNRVTWGDSKYPIEEEINTFYQTLNELVNPSKE